MVALLKCKCLNVTIHLQNEPKEIVETNADLEWLRENLNIKRFGVGEVGVAGTKVVVEKLATWQIKNKDRKAWKYFGCVNCNMKLFVCDPAKPSQLLVNLELLNSATEIEKLMESNNYSSTFKIILEDEDDISNTPLESPEEFDMQLWHQLQQQVDATVKREEELHQQRIDAFIREQQQLLLERQSKAFKDRKIIWHKICKHHLEKTEAAKEAVATPSFIAAQPSAKFVSASVPTTSPFLAAKPLSKDRPSTSPPPILAPATQPTQPSTSPKAEPQKTQIPTTPTSPTNPATQTTPTTPVTGSVPAASTISERDRVSRPIGLKPLFGESSQGKDRTAMGGLLTLTKERTVEPLAVAAAAAVAAPIFSFEDTEGGEPELVNDYDFNSNNDDLDAELEADTAIANYNSRREAAFQEEVSQKSALNMLSASLPISIPMPPARNLSVIRPADTEAEDDGTLSFDYPKKPHEIVELEENQTTEISKSFAVPLSMTRRLKSYF